MSHNIIKIENLVKNYDLGDLTVHALRGIDFNIEKGEFVAIMGPSGSGKSTLLNILGCLDNATSGNYFLDDVDVKKLTKDQLATLRNEKIGFVFQSYNLLARTTALENVELPLFYNSSVSAKERRERAVAALETVGLSDRMYHFSNQLSGGQQQRVAIARSLVNDPVIILADEPTGNLDTRTSYDIMDVFQKLNSKGITIGLVTHESDIAQFTSRNVTFRDGRIKSEIIVENIKNASEALAQMPVEVDY